MWKLDGTTLNSMCCNWQGCHLTPFVFLRVIALCFQSAKCIPVTSPNNEDFVTLYSYPSIPSGSACRFNQGPLVYIRVIHLTTIQVNRTVPATLKKNNIKLHWTEFLNDISQYLIQTLHNLTSVYKFSTPFLYISCGTYRENLSNNQELLEFVIISVTLITLMFDSGVILLGEIRCLSLLDTK